MSVYYSVLFLILSLLSQSRIATAETASTFRVGLILPLSGPAADYGIAIQNSFALAREDYPDRYKNIEFIVEDVQYNPSLAVLALKKLIQQDKVHLAITWGVGYCEALSPVAESLKTPLIGICLNPTAAKEKEYVLRFQNVIDEVMQKQTEFFEAQKIRRIGILLAENPYLEEAFQALRRNLRKGQTIELLDQMPSNESDLKRYVIKAKKKEGSYDALGVFLFAGQIADFYKQSTTYQLKLPTFGTGFFESISEIRASQGKMEGALFSGIHIQDKFVYRYKQKYKNESQLGYGALGYELALLLGELFQTSGSTLEPLEVMSILSVPGVRVAFAAGPFRFIDSPGYGKYFQFPLVIKKVRGEGFKEIF